METAKLKKFAQFARRSLLEQVTAKLKLVLAEESPARRERPQAIKKLEEAVTDQGKEQRRLRKQVQHYPKRVLPCHPATIT